MLITTVVVPLFATVNSKKKLSDLKIEKTKMAITCLFIIFILSNIFFNGMILESLCVAESGTTSEPKHKMTIFVVDQGK